LRAATETGFVLASELRACGVDFSFTPVLDLDYGVSEVIGNRALHEDPAVVALLARALVQGLSQAGMAACGKHFPGHGAVAADSHLAIPVDERPLDEILEADAAPYRWLGDLALPAVMPAHVIYPQVAPEPAGFSRRWVPDILRGRFEYDGVECFDALTAEGASGAGRHAGPRHLSPGGARAGRILAPLGDRHPAWPLRVRRCRVFRRSHHGRRQRGRRHPRPGAGRAGGRLRHGAGLQPPRPGRRA